MAENINRLNKFFSEDDFLFNDALANEYLNNDLNTTIILYQIDRAKTVYDDVYGQKQDNQYFYKDPVKIHVILTIQESENKNYDTKTGTIRYNEPGNLLFSVMISELKNKNIEITYGDIVGYTEIEGVTRFYVVNDDGKVVTSSKNSLFGYKPMYRKISCTPMLENEFNP